MYREVSAPVLFFSAQWNPAIRWRTKEFKLKWGGVATESEIDDGDVKKVVVVTDGNGNDVDTSSDSASSEEEKLRL